MGQDRLNNLARLSIESDIAKHIDFDTVIRSFAKKKARKATLLIKSVYFLTSKCTIICIFSADCGVHETGLLVYISGAAKPALHVCMSRIS